MKSRPLIFMLLATVFWISAHIIGQSNGLPTWYLLQSSACIISFCFIFENLIQAVLPSCPKQYVFAHFALGLLQHMFYLISYLVRTDFFITYWKSIFFGYYIWTMTLLACRPQVFFPSFAKFYCIHHSAAFIITGIWALIPNSNWDDKYMSLGAMIWLTSDCYVYFVNAYRALNPGLGNRQSFKKLQKIIFCIERIHRSSAYIQGLILCKGSPSQLGWCVLGTTLFIDLVDTKFQITSISRSASSFQDKELHSDHSLRKRCSILVLNGDNDGQGTSSSSSDTDEDELMYENFEAIDVSSQEKGLFPIGFQPQTQTNEGIWSIQQK